MRPPSSHAPDLPAATEAEAIALVDELLVGEAKRRQMELGAWFVNVAAPVSKL